MNKKFWLNGSAGIDVVIGAAILIFIVLPVFSTIIERYILLNKVQIIRDAADITNISVYNSINTVQLGKTTISFDSAECTERYKELLAKNLKLNSALEPLPGSIAEGQVCIEALEFYTSSFPVICPLGKQIERPAVHSCITVPVKPSLYRKTILGLLGKSYIVLKIHVDSDIPVNN